MQNEKNKHYLAEIIELFVVKEKHARFLDFVQSEKRYDDFLDELFIDPRNLKTECLIEVPSNQKSPEIIFNKLRKLGAGKKAYILSESRADDGKFSDLQEIVHSAVGRSIGTIIYCVGTRLGYYEDSEMFQYILKV